MRNPLDINGVLQIGNGKFKLGCAVALTSEKAVLGMVASKAGLRQPQKASSSWSNCCRWSSDIWRSLFMEGRRPWLVEGR